MQARFLSLIIILQIISSNSQASIICNKPKLSKPSVHNSIYHFKAAVTCELLDENINFKTLKDAYLSDVTKRNSQFKVHKQSNYSAKNMTGYSLDVTQSYNTPDGAMKVRANIIIADDQSKNFYYELHSKAIIAEGDAQYEKMMINTTALEILPDKSKLLVTKEIDVEKPWYAPDSIFFETVASRLEESMHKSALLNARKICCEDVDPLRK